MERGVDEQLSESQVHCGRDLQCERISIDDDHGLSHCFDQTSVIGRGSLFTIRPFTCTLVGAAQGLPGEALGGLHGGET